MLWLVRDFDLLSVLLRAATLSLEALTVGGVFFLLIALPRSGDDALSLVMRSSVRRATARFALALAMAQAVSTATSCAVLMGDSGLSLGEVASAGFFFAGCSLTAFALLLFLVLRLTRNRAASLPLALAITGASVTLSHAASRLTHRPLLLGLTAAHHLGTAAWIGAMPHLLFALRRVPPDDTSGEAARVVRRFSAMAIVSVAVLVLAGIGLAWFYVGAWSGLYGTSYGVMILAKTYLLLLALTLGAGNYLLGRRIHRAPVPLLKRLRRFSEVEIGLGFTAVLAAASLTAQSPAADVMQDRVTRHEIVERAAWKWPSFKTPAVAQLAPPTTLAVAVREAPFTGGAESDANDRAWSEYNHHWAGLIVLACGALALVSRLPRQHWARHWPLLFLGLAVFLLLRADPENWPLGPRPFWASFTAPDVLEHRLFVLLIVAFAFYEWGLETGHLRWPRAAYVFPAICAVGGALLLTHSHALGNVKDEMYAEMSHTPIALLGATAGWGRWLELRLPGSRPARIAAWVWPVCLLLVGLVLLDYREA